MVSSKKLLKRIEEQDAIIKQQGETIKQLANSYSIVLKSCISLNKKVLKLIKKDGSNEDKELIKNWLEDERIQKVQDYLNEAKK
jgi:hypothetical protein